MEEEKLLNESNRSRLLLQDDKLDVSTPKLYSSFIPNGHSEAPLGDGDLSLSQVGGRSVSEDMKIKLSILKYESVLFWKISRVFL